jgi:xanthine dehydrogenase/oxidase
MKLNSDQRGPAIVETCQCVCAAMLSISVNGVAYNVDPLDSQFVVTPNTSLAEFLRTRCKLTATKVSCDEGGCGACTVALTFFNQTSQRKVTRAINACLAPLLSLNGLEVTTNDQPANALHRDIQEQLADDYGTQCGYCSSGMVMAMYSLLQENPHPSKIEVERMLDGNLCRCTGYRPILTAFRKFGAHADGHQCNREKCCKKLEGRELEIEDAARIIKPLKAAQHVVVPLTMRTAANESVPWIECDTEAALRDAMSRYAGKRMMLCVAGTTQALDRVDYEVYLSVRNIPEFTAVTQNDLGVTFGAAVTVTDLKSYLSTCESPVVGGTRHFAQVCAHLHRVASTLIRNRGAVVGNIIFTKAHQTEGNSFPSDAVIVLLGIGASITLFNVAENMESTMSLEEFMRHDSTGTYVRSVSIPWAAANEVFKSYKIAIRRTLDHALVNGAMRAVVDPQTGLVVGKPSIFIGGLFPAISRLPTVEEALHGADLRSESDFTQICDTMAQTLSKHIDPTPGRDEYRRAVAVNYMYRFLLSIQPNIEQEDGTQHRDVECWIEKTEESSGTQRFGEAVPGSLPVSKAITKFDGIHQTSGSAIYTADIPTPAGCLFSAIVSTDRANVKITNVDASAAIAVPGFVRFFSAKDLDEKRNEVRGLPLFVIDEVAYAGEIVGLVVAETEEIARHCGQLIEAGISYTAPHGKLLLTLKAAKRHKPVKELEPVHLEEAKDAAADDGTQLKAEVTITGRAQVNSQYHCFLENHSCLANFVEGQLYIDAPTQGVQNVQRAVCEVNGMPHTDVIVSTRRIGGGFGGKFEAPMNNAAMAGLAARTLGRPVRLNLSFKESMRCFGARPVYDFDYELGATKDGRFVSLKGTINITTGAICGKSVPGELENAQKSITNAYYFPNLHIEAKAFTTHLPPTVPVRGPGWLGAIALMEMVAAQAAQKLNIPLEELKQRNFITAGKSAPGGLKVAGTDITYLWDQAYPKYVEMRRDTDEFNRTHQFLKRGVAISPARFIVNWLGPFNAFVAVHEDGSVTVSHGGIEIGQGINTKVQQCVAMAFGLSEDDAKTKVKTQPCISYIASNPGNVTGGSVTTEMCCLATLNACAIIKERLKPFLSEFCAFPEAAQKALEAGVDLNACGMAKGSEPGAPRYHTWGCAVTMVEVDVLTGQFVLLRSDLVFDCGVSMNPYLDIGQVEGGFAYGLGWYTSEETNYDAKTGKSTTAGTWEYKPPGAYDVPTVLNVTLLENSHNKTGVLNSKAVAEPAVALANSVVYALQDAINASRADLELPAFAVSELPLTVDLVQTHAGYTSTKYLQRNSKLRERPLSSPGIAG